MRNGRRSITTMLALIVAVCAVLLFGGYAANIKLALQTDYVQHSGHLQVQRKGYFKYGNGNAAAFGIAHYQTIVDRIKADPVLQPMLLVVTPTLQLGGIAGNFSAGVSRTVFAQGLQPEEQSRMREWNDYSMAFPSRQLALTGTPLDSIVMGFGVARVLHLCGPLHVPACEDAPSAPANAAVVSAAPDSKQPQHTVTPGSDAPSDIVALSQLEPAQTKASASATRVEVLTASTSGAPNVASFNVVKAEQQGVKELDDLYVEMHLPSAQRLVYGREEPRVTAIAVQLRHTSMLPAARQRLEQLLAESNSPDPLEVLDFATLNPFYDQTNRMFDTIFGFVFVLIAAIVLFVVSNTMTMAIVERTVEIGTLRAVGLRRSGVQALFVSEGLLLGLVGALLGVLASLSFAWLINHSGVTWIPPARTDAVPVAVRVWGEWSMITLTFFGLAIIAGLSAWFPARRAARMPIVDALRHV
ncbi:MAG TPA: FtsX-like permease family protein [Burkholderiaceae bacterium]|nr:FtsX-like permease family protein [Burkholderiaceae bacterium]